MHRRILIVLSLISAVGSVTYLAWSYSAPTGPLKRRSVEKMMRQLGGLAPIPKSVRDVRVASPWFKVTASFTAPREDIQRWINESPGLQGFTGQRIDSDTRFRYGQLTGNQSVQVTIDEATNYVDVVVQGDPL